MRTTRLNRKYLFKTVLFVCLVLLIAAALLGCGLFKQNSGQESRQEKQSEKIPKQLEAIEANIENIFLALDGPVGKPQEEGAQQTQQGQEKPPQNQGQEKPEAGSQGQEEAQSGTDQSKQPGQQEQKGQASNKDPWQQISQEIKNLHSAWNDYLPEATKKGGKKEALDGFSSALNNLTKITAEKDSPKALLAANRLYYYVPDLYSLYQAKTSPELKRMIYYTRNSVLASKIADWGLASKDMEEIKSSWSIVKNTVSEEQMDSTAKLDLSIYELEKVIKEQNAELVAIKGQLTLANITELNEAAQETGGKQ
jgi:hypothetical protein